MGRGRINHNQITGEEYPDLLDGRVKVDSWNMNYNRKKKKLKKQKISSNQKKKMKDLQEIYGIDAKTLAGLSKGRLPRKLLATGKLKGDGPSGADERGFQTENSFRSTQNTFQNKQSTAAKSRMKQSINDNTSNMFSFNGYGTSRRWNEIESTLKGAPMRDSRMDKISQYDKRHKNNKRNLNQSKAKMTSTQDNFNRSLGRNQNQFMEEESKSGFDDSRNGSSIKK